MITCSLCEKIVEKLHPKSHILPNWMDNHDPQKRGLVHFNDDGRQKIIQTGWYATIVCPACEVGFGSFDQYASLILGEKNFNSRERCKIVQTEYRKGGLLVGLGLSGVEFIKLHKFALSVVLKSHLERIVNGRGPLLVGEAFQRMRSTYLAEDPLERSFPLFIFGLYEENNTHTTCLTPYLWDSVDGIPLVMFQGAGYQFFISLAEGAFPSSFSPFFGKADGTFIVPITDFKKTGTYKRMLEMVEASQKQLSEKRRNRKK